MFLNSIRWRLQIWYGLILVSVLAGFGFTAYQLERGRQFRRIDDELQRRVNAVAAAFRPPPRREGPGRPGLDRMPPDLPPPGDAPPPDSLDGERPAQPFDTGGNFHIPAQTLALFDETDPNGFYYVVWRRDHQELARSTNAPTLAAPILPAGRMNSVDEPLDHPGVPELQPPQTRSQFREMVLLTPPGDIVLAGRSTSPELMELHRIAWKLAAVGGVILLLGLAGGWRLATRAIRPIDDISSTAVRIAAGDLTQRINAADTESELGRLAMVLNSTFARLEAAFAQQQQFASDAAHELRTPVSVMLTQTQTALHRERSDAEYREAIEACQRSAQRMRRLIESLLELARLDAGQETMKRMNFDLAQTVRECVALTQTLADERRVKIHCDLPHLPCFGDPERLAQVVTNLLTNAIQHNQPNGEVKISSELRNGMIALQVSNTGSGISEADMPRIFERFYRADKARSPGGAGLGLAICKAIVEAHGGKIEATSQPGKGVTFTVYLPTDLNR